MNSDRNTRVRVTGDDIIQEYAKKVPLSKRVELFPDYTKYMPRLYKTMELPSYVHGYSLAIDYMKRWFLQKFPKDNTTPTGTYFKTIYINGSHILDNWKNWNNYNIKREKPMLAIVPTVSTDHDRDTLDMYMGDATLMLKSSNFQDSFLKDYYNKIFLYTRLREMEMNFAFKIRVNSRSEQLDLFNKLELKFRVGTTQQDNLSADFHIPYNIILQIAKDAHFEVKDDTIIDIPAFVSYLNMHSSAPIIYKIRSINQKPAFFVRARNLYTHLAIRDKIQLDDGESNSKLETNFHLEMNVQLRMPIPHFYAYMNQVPITDKLFISETKPAIGIYTVNNYHIPPENKMGWPSISVTSYLANKGEEYIDISEIFNSKKWPVAIVVHNDMDLSISPEGFLDVKVFRSSDYENMTGIEANYHMDYRHMRIVLEEEVIKPITYEIAIYADMSYVNNRLATIESYKERFSSDQIDHKTPKSLKEQNIQ